MALWNLDDGVRPLIREDPVRTLPDASPRFATAWGLTVEQRWF